MTPPGNLAIRPLTPGRWPDLERLFGPNGACAGCWCMWWRRPRAGFRTAGSEAHRRAFQAIVAAGPPPGLLAYAGDQPVGWCQVTPRADLPGLERARLLAPVDDRPVWSVSCFFIKARHRRQGLTQVLIEAAKTYAKQGGCSCLEAYPWDIGEKKASGTIYTGRASTFLRLGFEEVARRAPHRPVLRCDLTR